MTTAARGRVLLGCWIAWAIVVASRVYRVPAQALPIAAVMQNAVACAFIVIALGAIGFAVVGSHRWLAPRLSSRVAWGATILAAALAPIWAAKRESWGAWIVSRHLPALPAFGEAAYRACSGMLGAAAVVLAACALGRLLVTAIGPADTSRSERWLAVTTTGFGALSFTLLGLAAAGQYRSSGVSIAIALCLAAGAVHTRWNTATAERQRARVMRPSRADMAWLIPAAIGCSFAIVSALAPETQFDALGYHLYLPRLWLEAGRPVAPIQEYTSLYPLTWELLFGAGLVMGGPIAAKLLHTLCLALIGVLVVTACRRWWPHASPFVALALSLTVPTMLWEAGTAYVDLALTLFACTGCYALARFAESSARPWAVIAALEFGLAAATKHLGLIVLAIALAAFVLTMAWRRARARSTFAAAACIAVLAMALPLPWWVRSWRASGNPFFPEAYGVFGGGPPERWDATANGELDVFKKHFGMRDATVLRLPWDVTVHAARFGGSVGSIWLILLPVLAVAGPRKRGSTILAAGCTAYVAVWASPISSYQMRFLVPIVPALAILGADAWERLRAASASAGRTAETAALAIVLTTVWLTLPPFTPLQERDRDGWTGWLTHVTRTAPVGVVAGRESANDYLAREVPSYHAWNSANAQLPSGARVLTFAEGDNFYSHVARIPADSVMARPVIWTARNAGDVRDALTRLGVTAALFDRRSLPGLRTLQRPIAMPDLQAACVTTFEDRDYRLCRWE